MCCTFNMKAADEIFLESQYLSMVQALQRRDANNSFGNAWPPSWYINDEEPR